MQRSIVPKPWPSSMAEFLIWLTACLHLQPTSDVYRLTIAFCHQFTISFIQSFPNEFIEYSAKAIDNTSAVAYAAFNRDLMLTLTALNESYWIAWTRPPFEPCKPTRKCDAWNRLQRSRLIMKKALGFGSVDAIGSFCLRFKSKLEWFDWSRATEANPIAG